MFAVVFVVVRVSDFALRKRACFQHKLYAAVLVTVDVVIFDVANVFP